MIVLSFIMECYDSSGDVSVSLDSIFRYMSRVSDYEIIIVSSAEDQQLSEQLGLYEKTHPKEITIVNCQGIDPKTSLFEIGLEYANGYCFWKVTAGKEICADDTKALLYNSNLIDDDSFKFLCDKYNYIIQSYGSGSFEYESGNDSPCTKDHIENAGSVDTHYFFQDIYVANRIYRDGAEHIYDIGSRLDGFLAHLLSMDIGVTMIGVRELPYKIENLNFIQGRATDLSALENESVEVLSSLHALEHIGLGGYGDPVDHSAWKIALNEYTRVLTTGGRLYLSVPVGKTEKVCFNAHRIFDPYTIVGFLKDDFTLEEFTFFHDGNKTSFGFVENQNEQMERKVFDHISSTQLGNYDCGIFILKRRA